jgi:hypothetical protein
MPPSRRYPLRIVVQHLDEPNSYRLVAYGDAVVYRPVEFASRADLVKTLHHIVPDLDESVWPSHDNLSETRIIFTAEVTIDDAQLQLAGLKTRA